MITTGVRDLKNNLSKYLNSVKNGAGILVTEHGRPIARILPEPQKKKSIEEQLAPLVADGVVHLPSTKLRPAARPTIESKGKMSSEIVIEDRR